MAMASLFGRSDSVEYVWYTECCRERVVLVTSAVCPVNFVGVIVSLGSKKAPTSEEATPRSVRSVQHMHIEKTFQK